MYTPSDSLKDAMHRASMQRAALTTKLINVREAARRPVEEALRARAIRLREMNKRLASLRAPRYPGPPL